MNIDFLFANLFCQSTGGVFLCQFQFLIMTTFIPLVQFLAQKSLFTKKHFNGEDVRIFGFNPEDVITILQVKIPSSVFIDQGIEKGRQLNNFPNTLYRSPKNKYGAHTIAHKIVEVQYPGPANTHTLALDGESHYR